MKQQTKVFFQTVTIFKNIDELENFIKPINDTLSFCDK